MVLVSRMEPSGRFDPILWRGQRRFAGGGGLEIVELGRQQRQGGFRQGFVIELAVGVAFPDDRERLAPVALAAEKPVAQFVIDGLLAQPLCLQPGGDLLLGFGGGQAGEEIAGIDADAVVDEADAIPVPCGRLATTWTDGQVEFRGELQIALVVRGHGHDRAGAVAGQDVIGDPDGNLLAVDRVDAHSAGEDAGFFLRQFGAFQVAFLGDLRLVCRDGRRCARAW